MQIHVLCDAIRGGVDKQIIITNDTDILPAIRMVKQECSNIFITIVTPPTYYPHIDLWKSAGQKRPSRIERIHIENSLLPEKIKIGHEHFLYMPEKYK